MKWAKSWKYYKYPFSDNLLSDQNGEFTVYPLDMNIAHSLANELGCPTTTWTSSTFWNDVLMKKYIQQISTEDL